MNPTFLVELKTQVTNAFNYTTYVFELLEQRDIVKYNTKYFMCVRWPNWESRDLINGESGYVEIQVNEAGKTTWWDGEKQVPYNYDSLQFVRFCNKSNNNQELIV